ncbi:MAG: DNA methyltransferase [Candidatus Pacearchaeota archaeon]
MGKERLLNTNKRLSFTIRANALFLLQRKEIQRGQGTNTYIHPTQKPAKLAEHFIINSTRQEENVLDVFGGSGSTLIACENKKRNCFLIEIDPNFCSHIIERWENLTGNRAKDELNNPMKLR